MSNDDYSGSDSQYDDGDSYDEGSYSQEGSYSNQEEESYDDEQGSYYSDDQEEPIEDGSEYSDEQDHEVDGNASQSSSARSEEESLSRSDYNSEEEDKEDTPPAFDATNENEGFGGDAFESFGDAGFAFDKKDFGFGSSNFDGGTDFGDAFGFSSESTSDVDFAKANFGSANFNDSGFADDAFDTAEGDGPSLQSEDRSESSSSDEDPSFSKSEEDDDTSGQDQSYSQSQEDVSGRDQSYSHDEEKDFPGRDQSYSKGAVDFSGEDQSQSNSKNDDSRRDSVREDGSLSNRDADYSDGDHSYSESNSQDIFSEKGRSDKDLSHSNRDHSSVDQSDEEPSHSVSGYSSEDEEYLSDRDVSSRQGDNSEQSENENSFSGRDDDHSDERDNHPDDDDDFSGADSLDRSERDAEAKRVSARSASGDESGYSEERRSYSERDDSGRESNDSDRNSEAYDNEQDRSVQNDEFGGEPGFGFGINNSFQWSEKSPHKEKAEDNLQSAFDQEVDFGFEKNALFRDESTIAQRGRDNAFGDLTFGHDDKDWENPDGGATDPFDNFDFAANKFGEQVPSQDTSSEFDEEENDDFGLGENGMSHTSKNSNQQFSNIISSTDKEKNADFESDPALDGESESETETSKQLLPSTHVDEQQNRYEDSENDSDNSGSDSRDLNERESVDESADFSENYDNSRVDETVTLDDTIDDTINSRSGDQETVDHTLADTINSRFEDQNTVDDEDDEQDGQEEPLAKPANNSALNGSSIRDKLVSRPGRTTNFNRYTREQMLKLSRQDTGTDNKKKKSKQKGKAEELVELVTNVTEVMIYLDELLDAGETEPDSDSHLLLHGFECLVGIFLQLSDELDVMSTFAKTTDRVAMDALKALMQFTLPLNDIFADLRPVVEHYFTHETDEEMNDLLYGMNLMVELLCELTDKIGEKQEWNERACTAYATLVELLSRDALEVISIYDDVDTPEYELSLEIEDAWNGTGHIEEFQTLEEASDLAVFRQICYEVLLSTDKWCPDTETLMNICGIEDVMLDEMSETEEIDESELAVTPETAVQVLDKISGPPLRRPALLASVLRRVLPGQKISDRSLAEHLTSIRSAMRSPLGLPASNLIGISSVPEMASDPNALGVAGVGKTTLAALVADHKDVRRHFNGGIAWIHLGQKELNYSRYIQCLRDLISQLEVAEEEEPAFPELLRTPGETPSQRRRREEGFLVFVRETMIAFLKQRPVLIILDDVCFESDLDWFDFGAPSDNPGEAVSSCVTLVTTRRRNLLPAADMVEVDMLEEDEAANLLVRESGDLAKTLKAGSSETRSVVRECAYHALAVKSVGRWLNLKHATSGEDRDPEELHKEVVESMQRIIKHGPEDDADMMYEILNMSLSPSINGEPTSIIKFCFAAFVHVFCDKEFISDFALADATPIVPLGTVEMLFEAILGLEEETLLKEGSLFYAQKRDAAKLIPAALSSLGIFKVITTVAGDEEDEATNAGAKEEKYLQIMHVVQQEYGEYLVDQDLSLRDLGVDAEQRWNKVLAKAYLGTKPQWDSDTPDASLDYFLEMMPVHLIRGEMLKEASSLLSNPAFVKGRLFALGRENGTRRHIKDCETLFDIFMKKKASTRKKYDPKGTLRNAYKALGDHLNMDEDEFIKEEGSPEAVEVGRCQFEIGFSLADKRLWELAIEHWEAAQEILVSALGMVEVVAGILYNVGVVYAEMNEYEQALGSLKQCLRVRGTIHGEDHILYAQTIQRIGDVFFKMSDYHEAMESYNWALDVMHIEPSHHRIDIGDILETMGKIHFYKGESDDALQCYQDALQSKQTELGEDHPELASIYDHMGNVLSEQGKNEDAIAHLVEAIRLKNLDMYGGDERDAEVMTMQGVLHVRQGKRKAGLDYYERALQILVTKAPHRKEHIASLLHYIACVYLVGGENKKAMKLFEESLQARRKVLGFVHLDVASTLFSMAYLHQKRNRLDKALKCLEEALKIRQLRLPDSEKVAVTHEKIGTIARSIGKLKKAENAFSEALRIRKLIHGDSHPAVAKVMQDLGDLMDDRGEYEEAMKNYREAYRIRKSFGGDTLPVAETLYTIGFTYSNSGHYEKALECLDAALKIQRLHNGEDSPECGDTLNMIGYLKAKCGQVDEAQDFLRDALRIRKLQGDRIKISETLKNIGNAHRSKQEYKSAMESYKECLHIRQRELGRENDKVADALVAIGNILADLSKPKDAMEAYQEALGIRARLFGDLDASLAPILQAMGMLDFHGKNYDRAMQLLNDYISIRKGNKSARDSEYVNVLFTIGNIYQLRHDDEQAKKAWTEAYETFRDLGLADSNPEHAEQVEKLMCDHGLGHIVQASNKDDEFPDEPMRRKGAGVLKLLKPKLKRGDGQNGMRRRKEKGHRL